MECIEKSSLAELHDTFQKMREFQLTHNALKKDIEHLYSLTINANNPPAILAALIRACHKEFFSLVEGDLYLINQFNPYTGYSDRDPMVAKFKKTYRHHTQVFKKHGLYEKFQSASFQSFLLLTEKRHGFTHPKGRQSLLAKQEDLLLFDAVFLAYNDHINALMANVGVSVEVPLFGN